MLDFHINSFHKCLISSRTQCTVVDKTILKVRHSDSTLRLVQMSLTLDALYYPCFSVCDEYWCLIVTPYWAHNICTCIVMFFVLLYYTFLWQSHLFINTLHNKMFHTWLQMNSKETVMISAWPELYLWFTQDIFTPEDTAPRAVTTDTSAKSS